MKCGCVKSQPGEIYQVANEVVGGQRGQRGPRHESHVWATERRKSFPWRPKSLKALSHSAIKRQVIDGESIFSFRSICVPEGLARTLWAPSIARARRDFDWTKAWNAWTTENSLASKSSQVTLVAKYWSLNYAIQADPYVPSPGVWTWPFTLAAAREERLGECNATNVRSKVKKREPFETSPQAFEWRVFALVSKWGEDAWNFVGLQWVRHVERALRQWAMREHWRRIQVEGELICVWLDFS